MKVLRSSSRGFAARMIQHTPSLGKKEHDGRVKLYAWITRHSWFGELGAYLHLSTKRREYKDHFPIRATTHSFWHNGHLLFCFTQSAMQQLWNEWLQSPQTTTHSSCLLSPWHLRQQSRNVNSVKSIYR